MHRLSRPGPAVPPSPLIQPVYIPANLPPFPGFASPNFTGGAWITGVAINPRNSAEAWATIGGLNVGHVWHTANAGAGTTWTDISGSLPNQVTDGIVIDPAHPN